LAADLREADRVAKIEAMDTDTAIRYYTDLLAKQPGDQASLQKLAELHLRKADTAASIGYYRQLRARARTTRRCSSHSRGRSAPTRPTTSGCAVRDYVKRNPSTARRLELAQTLASARDYTACGALPRVIEEEPGNVGAPPRLARILSWNREYTPSLERTGS